MNKELFKKIISKKEFSQLPKKDILLAFEKFDKPFYSDEEKIKLTRNLLRKVYSAFTSKKILSLKNKSEEWILRKHLSTRERLPYYEEIYKRILKSFENKKLNIIDLGAGINGFSYKKMIKSFSSLYQTPTSPHKIISIKNEKNPINYTAIEAIGQLVELMNYYFKKENLKNAGAIHLSLFEIGKIKKIVSGLKRPRIIFLFKVLDSLEMLERDYSKKLLLQIAPLVDRIIISFATESMIKRKKFKVKRNWILNFVRDNFIVIDDFEFHGERFIVFSVFK